MAISSTFVTGQVFTAADANLMANSGLVFVKQQTIGSGVGSVTVTSAFSSTYDNYLIVLSDTVGSTSTSLVCQLGSVTTGYRYSFLYTTYTNTPAAVGTSTATAFAYCGSITTTSGAAYFTLQNPFLSKNTFFQGAAANTSFSGNTSGVLATTDSFTAFTIITGAGTMTGGTIAVYGFRKG
jgi:hypothetical protein